MRSCMRCSFSNSRSVMRSAASSEALRSTPAIASKSSRTCSAEKPPDMVAIKHKLLGHLGLERAGRAAGRPAQSESAA